MYGISVRKNENVRQTFGEFVHIRASFTKKMKKSLSLHTVYD